MDKRKNVIITDTLVDLGTDTYHDYLAHAFCTAGSCRLTFNGKEFDFNQGDLLIVRKGKLVEKFTASDDFRVEVIYVASGFIELSTPQSNYGIKGQLSLFINPIMHLTAPQQQICRLDFETISMRLSNTDHHFYQDVMINAVQAMILDFFDFHSHLYGENDISTQNASIMTRFLAMLENGEYRKNREVTYYADKLCVTSKYLSEVSKKASGYSANYWINRYTILDISRLLRDKSLTFAQIKITSPTQKRQTLKFVSSIPGCRLYVFFEINHIGKQHPIIINWDSIIIREKIFYAMRIPKSAMLIEPHR